MPLPVLVVSFVGMLFNVLLVILRSRMGSIIFGALAWFGLTLAVHHAVMAPIIDQARALVDGIGTSGDSDMAIAVGQWLGYIHFDVALDMLFSAFLIREAMSAGRVYLARKGLGA